MEEATIARLKQSFKEYYYQHSADLYAPGRMEEREFGYMPFGGSMIRHLSLSQRGELVALLVREAPRGVYYSCAYYHHPSLPMDQKGFKGADLIFDIDTKDMKMPCMKDHDWWACRECQHMEAGLRPPRCPSCGTERIMVSNWICDQCMSASKEQVNKVIEILTEDIGVACKEIGMHFSGNMGYHLSVESKALEGLDQSARSELSDYISGVGITPESIGVFPQSNFDELLSQMPSPKGPGWRSRLMRKMAELAQGGEDSEQRRVASLFKKLGYVEFQKLLGETARKTAARIDPMVTADIHRIFRLPSSLHGETGLAKIAIRDPWSVDPFEEAVVLGDEPLDVNVSYSPHFRLKGTKFGPYKRERVKLPLYAAVYLMGKGLAEVEE